MQKHSRYYSILILKAKQCIVASRCYKFRRWVETNASRSGIIHAICFKNYVIFLNIPASRFFSKWKWYLLRKTHTPAEEQCTKRSTNYLQTDISQILRLILATATQWTFQFINTSFESLNNQGGLDLKVTLCHCAAEASVNELPKINPTLQG